MGLWHNYSKQRAVAMMLRGYRLRVDLGLPASWQDSLNIQEALKRAGLDVKDVQWIDVYFSPAIMSMQDIGKKTTYHRYFPDGSMKEIDNFEFGGLQFVDGFGMPTGSYRDRRLWA